MPAAAPPTNKKASSGFGTGPVFFTAISTILGAILFLRFGYAIGTLGFFGVLIIILVGHMVTIPTALSLSEISTNEKVEGGGEYFIISRSFGLNIGATIGIALYLSQAISVAFYVIAFTEAFDPLFRLAEESWGIVLPRQVVSLPAMSLLALLILRRGANLGVKALYLVVGILAISLVLFFLGKTEYANLSDFTPLKGGMRNMNQFFVVFAIVFPAFTGMTAGVGLSGDLKNPRKSIPLGTISATLIGLVVYFFVSWKLAGSASPADLTNNQLIMADIALYGSIAIPLGLAASTISSALGSIMVAPRTLQALGTDQSLPGRRLNRFLAKGKGTENEPYHASIITVIIAFVFVALGNVNAVASIISMFFMMTYGSLCLISFLYHFGADPSYRPSFRSRWFISLIGFIMSFYLMFKINTFYTLLALMLMVLIYLFIQYTHRERQGVEAIFQAAIFQLSRNLQVYLQKSKKIIKTQKWRPSVVCISRNSFKREDALRLVNWISFKYGFGTYIHLIEGYYSRSTHMESKEVLRKLIDHSNRTHNNVYLDTLISPSYTSAIAQVIQLPSISGLENNMIIFDYDKEDPSDLKQIVDNYSLVRSGFFDICILGSSRKQMNMRNGIHVWLKSTDFENANLMILISYIILLHPEWKKSHIKIFSISKPGELSRTRKELEELVEQGRLPISARNIEIIKQDEKVSPKMLVNGKSAEAGLTIIGFLGEQLKHDREKLFEGYDNVGNILFVNARNTKEL